jgi:hypothetical protein
MSVEIEKIQEVLDKLKDADKEQVKIRIAIELANLYGATRAYAHKYGLRMSDLHDFAKSIRKASK